ncbi:MAG: DUF4097 family beta strand repeat-containing protein [Terriglobales bacterium]|jgi:DUF4097 and DUF4098 domain-containing protein YvlB
MESLQRTTVVALVVVSCVASAALAQTRKEYRYTVGPNANISVDTQFGAISVKPGTNSQVIVIATLQSDKTEVDNLQHGNRIEIASHLQAGTDQQSGRVDYELRVPADATLSLRSSSGPLSAENLEGDLTLEGSDAVVDVHNMSNGHVHVSTMGGPITLSDIRNGHVEISSISGAVTLKSVTGPLVRANSGSGRIFYEGDFGSGGDYKLTTHSGDIEAIAPADTSADFSAHSIRGKVENDFHLQPHHYRFTPEEGRSFFGSLGKAASKVVLHSFSGRIRLKQR